MRLDHVGIFVSDLQAASAFYQRLDFVEIDRDEDDFAHIVILRRGDAEVHLFQPRAEHGRRIDHVAWRVSATELDDTIADLQARGVAFSGPHRYRQTRFIKMPDPDGNIIELIAELVVAD